MGHHTGFGFDPEAIHQDADVEMLELAEAADRLEGDPDRAEPCAHRGEKISVRINGRAHKRCADCGDRV